MFFYCQGRQFYVFTSCSRVVFMPKLDIVEYKLSFFMFTDKQMSELQICLRLIIVSYKVISTPIYTYSVPR
jgi:hypothetical protein